MRVQVEVDRSHVAKGSQSHTQTRDGLESARQKIVWPSTTTLTSHRGVRSDEHWYDLERSEMCSSRPFAMEDY